MKKASLIVGILCFINSFSKAQKYKPYAEMGRILKDSGCVMVEVTLKNTNGTSEREDDRELAHRWVVKCNEFESKPEGLKAKIKKINMSGDSCPLYNVSVYNKAGDLFNSAVANSCM